MEPNYVYLPGQGWALTEGYPVYDKEGKLMLLFDRPPLLGEGFINTAWHPEWVEHGCARLDLIALHVSKFTYPNVWKGYSDLHEEKDHIITVVPA